MTQDERSTRHPLGDHGLDRRTFLRTSAAVGAASVATGLTIGELAAQEATPVASPIASPAATPVAGETITSITRTEYFAQLKEHFAIEAPEVTGGEFIETVSNDVTSLNPILWGDGYSYRIIVKVFEGLAASSPIDGAIVPNGIAEYWEIAPDGVTYTFHLNENATWHDGTPVTADDVVFTFDAILDDASLSVRKGTVASAVASYRAIDAHTFELVGRAPSAVFLNDAVSQFGILPKHIWQDVPIAEFGSNSGSTGEDPSRVIGSGPFRFASRSFGGNVILDRNADYWDPDNAPIIDTYVYNVVVDTAAALASLQTGESDIAPVSPSQARVVIEQNPDLQVLAYDSRGLEFYFVQLDPTVSETFTDIRVRQAFLHALDRDLVAETVYDGYAVRADGTQPLISPAYDPDRVTTRYEYDPALAASLLDEAGWTVGSDGIRAKDGKRLSLELPYIQNWTSFDQLVVYLQQAWGEIGVELFPVSTPVQQLLERLAAQDFEILLIQWGFSADGGQGSLFRSDAFPPAGSNYEHYSNPEYDRLDTAAQSELDPEARRELLIDASNIINDEAVIGPVVFTQTIAAGSPRIHNFLPQGWDQHWWFRYTWLSE